MRKSIAALLLSLVCLTSAFAGSFSLVQLGNPAIIGAVVIGATNDLMIGAGGDLTNTSIASDNTMVIRTDTYGAYLWCPPSGALATCTTTTAPNGTAGTWQQLVTSTSMPVQFAANGQDFNDGVYEIQVCYSNSSIMYMMYSNYEQIGTFQSTVYKTTNGGQNWVATGYTPVAQQSGNQSGIKQFGPKLAIDHANCNNVIVGTNTLATNTLQYTTNGGTNWATVSTGQVPAANGNGYSGLVVNGNTVFVCSIGNGVYETTTGFSGTWTKLTTGTGPGASGCEQSALDFNSGVYYAIDTSYNLWSWNGTTWHEEIVGSPNDANAAAVSVDPTTSGHVYAIANHGEIDELVSGTWSGFSSSSVVLSTTGDIPWMTALGAGTVTPNNCVLDQTGAKSLYCPTLNGFWQGTWSGSVSGATIVTWNSMGRGIEQLVGIGVMSSPQYSTPFTSSWDRSAFHPNLTSYPTAIAPINGTGLLGGETIDYDAISGSGLVCGAFNGMFYGNSAQASACTLDGINWTAFNTYPSNAYPTGGSFGGVENLAVSNSTDMFFATNGQQPHYTTNYTINASPSITWNAITCPGISSWANFIAGSEFNGGTNTRVVAADRVTANLYYFYFSGTGFFQVSGGTCTAEDAITSVPGGAGINSTVQLETVPGVGGEYWVSVGPSGNPGGQPGNTISGLMYTTNSGAVFTAVTNITAAVAIGFGAPLGGQTHPAVYTAAWYKTSITGQSFTVGNSGTVSLTLPSGLNLAVNSSLNFDDGAGNKQWASLSSYNNTTGAAVINLASFAGSGTHSSWTLLVYGIWKCTVSCNASSTPTWTQMVGWPANSLDNIVTVSGDASIYNRLYVGFGGSGFAKFN